MIILTGLLTVAFNVICGIGIVASAFFFWPLALLFALAAFIATYVWYWYWFATRSWRRFVREGGLQ